MDSSTLGQIRSKFKIQSFLTETWLICADMSQDYKKCHLWLCTTIRHAKKMHFKNVKNVHFKNVITFTCFFFGHCTGLNKDIAVKFCMCVVCMYPDHIYSVFFNSPRFGKYLRKSKRFVEK